MFHRQSGTNQRPADIEHGHQQTQLPDHVTTVGEPDQRSQISGNVDHFRYRRCAQEVIAKDTYEQEYKEATGTRPEQTVVEPYSGTNQNGVEFFLASRQQRGMVLAEVFLLQG